VLGLVPRPQTVATVARIKISALSAETGTAVINNIVAVVIKAEPGLLGICYIVCVFYPALQRKREYFVVADS
jgi:hypothetical protein